MKLPKVEIKKILYPTDLSENARYAFSYAVMLAQMHGAELVILHVLMDHKDLEAKITEHVRYKQWEEIKSRNVEKAWTTLTGKRKSVMKAAVGDVLTHFHKNTVKDLEYPDPGKVEIVLDQGPAAEEILKQASKLNCDLIVMGTYGDRSFIDAMVGVGSTAGKVVQQSLIPVLVVRLPKS